MGHGFTTFTKMKCKEVVCSKENYLIDCRISREEINVFVSFRVHYMCTFSFGKDHGNWMVAVGNEMLR
jgi:hypothetical protein